MDDVARLVKERIDIVDYISRSVSLKKSGRNFVGLCPFHSEHTPSFTVSPDRQIFKCFGCGVSGDLFTFVMQSEGLTFFESLKLLANEAGVSLDRYHPSLSEEENVDARYYDLHEVASHFYHYLLMQHPVGGDARDFFSRRGIDWEKDIDLIIKFRLGYAPRSWNTLGTYLLKKGFSVDDIVHSGLGVRSYNKNGFYDMFRGRVMFPLFDKYGRVVGFSGRVLSASSPAKYINSPETRIFRKREFLFGFYQAKEAIRQKGEVIIVEGEMDVISSHRVGVANVVAVKGSALTEEHVALLCRVCSRLLLCFDADSAGDAAMRKAVSLAASQGFEVKVIQPLVGKDADECIQQGASFWFDSIAGAVLYYDFLIQSALKRHNVKSAYGQRAVIQDLRPFISSINDVVLRSHYIQKLSTFLDFSQSQLEKIFLPRKSSSFVSSRSDASSSPQFFSTQEEVFYERVYKMERYILSLLLRMEKFIEDIGERFCIDDIHDKSVRLVYTLYIDFFTSHSDTLVVDFLQQVADAEALSVINDVFLIDVPFDCEHDLRGEIDVAIRKWQELVLREQLRLLSLEIRRVEFSGEGLAALDALQEKMHYLHDRLARLHKVD